MKRIMVPLLSVLTLLLLSACQGGESGVGFAGVILLVIGIVNTAAPRFVWYLKDGWKFKDAEPSDDAISLTRAGGIIAIIIGLIALLAG